MRLRTEVFFKQAWLTDVKMEPGESEPKVTLHFRTHLTPDLADTLYCRELVYAGSVPRSGVEQMVLEGEEAHCQVEISSGARIDRILAKSVGHTKIVMEGVGPALKFQVKLEGYAQTAADMIVEFKKDPVELTLKPAQMDLDLQKAEGESQDEPAEEQEDQPEEDAKMLEEMGIMNEESKEDD